ncbi:PCRF domain-containing protein, partial [Xylella fastidiosa subsp. multiplex]|uniref:PCRF domain-containing protein n=1 Tax=Xylella fastidiosa TaxID=2371 RepID=UPI0012ACEC9D
MQPPLRRKIEALAERHEELERLLSDPKIASDTARFRTYSRELAQLAPIATTLAPATRPKADLAAAETLRPDPEMPDLA